LSETAHDVKDDSRTNPTPDPDGPIISPPPDPAPQPRPGPDGPIIS